MMSSTDMNARIEGLQVRDSTGCAMSEIRKLLDVQVTLY